MVGRLNLSLYGTLGIELDSGIQRVSGEYWFQARSGVTMQLLAPTKRALLDSAAEWRP